MWIYAFWECQEAIDSKCYYVPLKLNISSNKKLRLHPRAQLSPYRLLIHPKTLFYKNFKISRMRKKVRIICLKQETLVV